MQQAETVDDRKDGLGEEPLLPTHSEDGVDLTLIRWMLSLTPAERLQVLENNVNDVLSIRRGFS